MAGSRIDQISQLTRMRLPLFLTVGVAGFTLILAALGLVGDFVALGILFSILGFPMTVMVFWAARYLQLRFLRTRLSALRDEDRRNRHHLIATIVLCRSLVVGDMRSSPDSTVASAPTTRHIAYHVGLARSQYDYLLSKTGRRIADRVRDSALNAISGLSCMSADLSGALYDLGRLEGSVLKLDDPRLRQRRLRAAGAEDPAPE